MKELMSKAMVVLNWVSFPSRPEKHFLFPFYLAIGASVLLINTIISPFMFYKIIKQKGMDEGYGLGYNRGRSEVAKVAPFDSEMKRRLLFLCHPDKHNDSLASRKATEWLMELRNN